MISEKQLINLLETLTRDRDNVGNCIGANSIRASLDGKIALIKHILEIKD
jgi:hypothetical protein